MRWLLLRLIYLYQITLSRLIGPTCRFEPSCSRYTATCIERFGAVRGSWLGFRRILRCHPFNPGGHDPPPDGPDGSRREQREPRGGGEPRSGAEGACPPQLQRSAVSKRYGASLQPVPLAVRHG